MGTIKIKKTHGKLLIILLLLILLLYGLFLLFHLNLNFISKKPITQAKVKFDFAKQFEAYLTTTSESEKTDIRSEFEKNAVVSSTITLTNCIPSPRIVAIKHDTKLTIKNLDNSSHQITFNEDHIFDIEKNESRVITANFGKGMGMYTFSCDATGKIGVVFTIL